MSEVMTMPNEPDYKAAYEILLSAVENATRVLQKAHLRTTLKLRVESGELTAEDETGLEEEIAAFNRLHGPHKG